MENQANNNTSPAIEAMQCYAQTSIQLFNCDNLELMAQMEDESVDVILTDPPYLYLKNQKLERAFDEQLFFSECKRLLTKNGFIVMFGRGISFYKWNAILDGLGFVFKEEIVWDKSQTSSPLMRLSRIHETISIFTKEKGTINKVKVPYLEMKSHNIDSIITDIKRLKTTFKNTKSLDAVLDFLENNKDSEKAIRVDFKKPNKPRNGVTAEPLTLSGDRCVDVMQSVRFGLNEKSIIRSDWNGKISGNEVTVNNNSVQSGDRCVNVMQSVRFGLNEKSIIKQVRDHYISIHPTQKPVRLLERLLALVIPKDKECQNVTVLDPFGGSFSTMEAVYNMGMQGIACEIDEEYYNLGKERIEKLPPRQISLFP